MNTTKTRIQGMSQTQFPTPFQNGNKLKRDEYARALVDEYIASAGKREFKDLIIGMSYLEVIYDPNRQRKLVR